MWWTNGLLFVNGVTQSHDAHSARNTHIILLACESWVASTSKKKEFKNIMNCAIWWCRTKTRRDACLDRMANRIERHNSVHNCLILNHVDIENEQKKSLYISRPTSDRDGGDKQHSNLKQVYTLGRHSTSPSDDSFRSVLLAGSLWPFVCSKKKRIS